MSQLLSGITPLGAQAVGQFSQNQQFKEEIRQRQREQAAQNQRAAMAAQMQREDIQQRDRFLQSREAMQRREMKFEGELIARTQELRRQEEQVRAQRQFALAAANERDVASLTEKLGPLLQQQDDNQQEMAKLSLMQNIFNQKLRGSIPEMVSGVTNLVTGEEAAAQGVRTDVGRAARIAMDGLLDDAGRPQFVKFLEGIPGGNVIIEGSAMLERTFASALEGRGVPDARDAPEVEAAKQRASATALGAAIVSSMDVRLLSGSQNGSEELRGILKDYVTGLVQSGGATPGRESTDAALQALHRLKSTGTSDRRIHAVLRGIEDEARNMLGNKSALRDRVLGSRNLELSKEAEAVITNGLRQLSHLTDQVSVVNTLAHAEGAEGLNTNHLTPKMVRRVFGDAFTSIIATAESPEQIRQALGDEWLENIPEWLRDEALDIVQLKTAPAFLELQGRTPDEIGARREELRGSVQGGELEAAALGAEQRRRSAERFETLAETPINSPVTF